MTAQFNDPASSVRAASSVGASAVTAARSQQAGAVSGTWAVEILAGSPSGLLDAAEPAVDAGRTARVHVVQRPALVLGSAQAVETVAAGRAGAAGVEVVRRRSGGGAVLLAPAAQVWVDFFVPRADSLWHDNIATGSLWAGEVWAACLSEVCEQPAEVHRGALQVDRWGRLACLASLGPGEVKCGGRKVVGVSQRRGRARMRVQTVTRLAVCGPLADWPEVDEFDFLSLEDSERAAGKSAFAARVGAVRAHPERLTEALIESLASLD